MGKEDPREVKLPSKEELATLPRRAVIAFAARCARRVQPLFQHFWPDAPQVHVDAIDGAISFAQASAERLVSTSGLHAAAANAAAAATNAAAANAANAAYAAAVAATNAAMVYATDNDGAFAAARDATVDARNAAAAYAAAYPTDLAAYAAYAASKAAMRRDYELLKAAAEREHWTDDTPVPPEFFGPLWPDGEPEGWPVKEIELDPEPVEIVIDLEVPDDADDEQVAERIRELVAEMDGMHRTMGGGGLTVAGVDVEVETGVREGVPS